MFTIDTSGLGILSAKLKEYGEQISGEVAMSGTAAMAKVIYDEARLICPESDNDHFFYGTSFKKTGQKYFFKKGTLKASIYRTFSKEESSDTLKLYKISWNHTKAPYGFMVEFGTSRAPAHSFLRKSADRMSDAVDAANARMAQKLSEIGDKS